MTASQRYTGMRVTDYALERRAVERELCPACGASRGELCVSKSGKVAKAHTARKRLAVYTEVGRG